MHLFCGLRQFMAHDLNIDVGIELDFAGDEFAQVVFNKREVFQA